MKSRMLPILLLAPLTCFAGGGPNAPSDQRVVVRVDREHYVANAADISWVSLRVPVEGLAVRVVLTSRESEQDARMLELERADKQLHDYPMPGTTLLDVPTMDPLPARPAEVDENSPYDLRGMPLVRCILFPANRVGSASALNKTVKDYLAQMKLPKSITAEVDGLSAVVSNPQAQRGKMLALIQTDVAQIRTTFGSNTVIRLEGLQNPLQVRLVSDREAELFMNYRMTIDVR